MQKQTSLWVVSDKEEIIQWQGALENVIIYPFTINERNYENELSFQILFYLDETLIYIIKLTSQFSVFTICN